MGNIIYYKDEDFKNEIISKEGITLVDFFATWCVPCQMLGVTLEELAKEAEYKIVKVDVEQARELSSEYGVRSVPTMFIFKDGEIAEQVVGALTKDEIIEKVNKYI